MRHPERELKDKKAIIALLERSFVGRIATVNTRGFPVIKPVNFLYRDGKIFLHSSKNGEKMTDIRRGSPVCFEVDEPIAFVPAKGSACKASYYYRSVIIKGKAGLVNHRAEKLRMIKGLMEKYQPEGGYEEVPDQVLRKTAVIEIFIQEITGKENLG